MQRRGLYAPEGPFVCGVNFVDADVGDVDRDLARAGVRDVDVDDLDRVGSAGFVMSAARIGTPCRGFG